MTRIAYCDTVRTVANSNLFITALVEYYVVNYNVKSLLLFLFQHTIPYLCGILMAMHYTL